MAYTRKFTCGCGCGREVVTSRYHAEDEGPFYFSNACRQRAYRQRMRDAEEERLRQARIARQNKRNG